MNTFKLNGNAKWLFAIGVPLIGIAVGWGALREDVYHVEREIIRIEQQHWTDEARIEQRLIRIENKLDRLMERD
jgi:hypothetical protein